MISRKLMVVGTTLNGQRQTLDIEEQIDLRSELLLRELADDPIEVHNSITLSESKITKSQRSQTIETIGSPHVQFKASKQNDSSLF
jgi:hypothetical protein